jgi:hypothetical protein
MGLQGPYASTRRKLAVGVRTVEQSVASTDLASVNKETSMRHTDHVRLTPTELKSSVLEGASVYGADNHKVGKVDHVHGAGVNSTAIIDVGGFLGMGAKPVAVLLTDLDFMRDEDGEVHAVTAWTKDQLKEMPEHHH